MKQHILFEFICLQSTWHIRDMCICIQPALIPQRDVFVSKVSYTKKSTNLLVSIIVISFFLFFLCFVFVLSLIKYRKMNNIQVSKQLDSRLFHILLVLLLLNMVNQTLFYTNKLLYYKHFFLFAVQCEIFWCWYSMECH